MSAFAEIAADYFTKVENYIYTGNDIRADAWMDQEEKKEALKKLDQARTIAHDALIKSYCENFDFRGIENRTQLADRVAMMVFEFLDEEPHFVSEGTVRDELAEMLHTGKIRKEEIIDILSE